MSTTGSGTPAKVILDVGSNAGDFAVTLATRNPGHRVLAVEPVELLADGIRERARHAHLDNVEVVQLAVDREEGPAEINVAQVGDWGVSSLLAFDAGSIADDDYWSVRPDLVHSRTETVQRVTLQRLMDEHGVAEVDFLKLDVQGLDLVSLESAGEAVPRIRAGMLEVPTASRVRLYANEDQDLARAYSVLERLGFEVYAVKANDPACNEVNVYFIRRGEDAAALERELGLRGVDLYDGKHFWAIPAATVEDLQAAEALPAEAARLRTALSAEIRARREAEQSLAQVTDEVGLARTREVLLRREIARSQVGTTGTPAAPPSRSAAELTRLRAENDGLRRRVEELTVSSSWRVTAPLRRAGALARRLVGRR